MDTALEDQVRRRAGGRCEYCHLPEQLSGLGHVLDHIIARQHRGQTTPENLALACGRCNASKGPNLAGIDPQTGQLTRLFHPRTDIWHEHFRWGAGTLVGLTPVGRTTIEVLAINHSYRVAAREVLIATGRWIPD